jgi:hypothetical protein
MATEKEWKIVEETLALPQILEQIKSFDFVKIADFDEHLDNPANDWANRTFS